MWFPRLSTHKLKILAKNFPVVVLTGARQTGKTSLTKKTFPDYNYVSLDVPAIAELAEKDPTHFFSRYQPPIIIDEVQYAPEIFRHIKAMVDKERHTMGQFILTGSQKFIFMQSVSESLAGRAGVMELENLSAFELDLQIQSQTEPNVLLKVLTRGGFPELWRNPTLPEHLFYNSYLATYIERDVRKLINVKNTRDFDRFIRSCATKSSQLLDKSKIASEVGVSSKTITNWINVLQASNQISILEPWFLNFGKRMVKTPKLYFHDTGLLCHLLGITEQNLLDSPFLGAIWETYVFTELRKFLSTADTPYSLWFYRDSQNLEVDFLLLQGGNAILMEAKWHEIPTKKDANPIWKLMNIGREQKIADLNNTRGFIICRSPEKHPLGENTSGVSVFSIKELLEK